MTMQKRNLKKVEDLLVEQKAALGKMNGALKRMENAMQEFNNLFVQLYTR